MFEIKNENTIEIDIDECEMTCAGCPTIFDFVDRKGARYYFRLRHGFAYIDCEDNNETLISGDMIGFDGVCSWNDIVQWAKNEGVLLNY
ncbi:hypothetical protein ACFQZE_06365 [Paenibacillus sp. GCM10027627]|uniref:hypothetical protein n=1 Tax=unclassified Paenibacillus TaxID=185978 RepID=UPI0036277464